MDRSGEFPVGAAVEVDELAGPDAAHVIARLRDGEPVSWLPCVQAWLVTRRDTARAVMRDAERFTVDDPRFSTAAVIGPSILSLDGPPHQRHRDAYAPTFTARNVREQFEAYLATETRRLVAGFIAEGRAELRTTFAGPLAVNVITHMIGWQGLDPATVLRWTDDINAAITEVSLGRSVTADQRASIDELEARAMASLDSDAGGFLAESVHAGGLRRDELGAAAALSMFGGIETAEGMTANALWHLLTHPDALAAVRADRDLLGDAIEESLRLEPAASVIDRYTTTDVELDGVSIPKGELVRVSLLGANRDPEHFDDPDRFDIHRANARQHLAFVHGPHNCLGIHLARRETAAAIGALLDATTELALEPTATPPEGLIFRKPITLAVNWR